MSIIYIGMDVHTSNYTLAAYSWETGTFFAEVQIPPDINQLEKYLLNLKAKHGPNTELRCGYEAGCLGYSLCKQLILRGYSCSILAPTSLPSTVAEIKTDRRDARKIARCLANGTFSQVYMLSEHDEAVRNYIRNREDTVKLLKQTKQQIIAFCTALGKQYPNKNYWTGSFLEWLRKLEFDDPLNKETLEERLITYDQLVEKIARYDKKILEMSQSEQYRETVNKLVCLKGISYYTALSLTVEIGDFYRFPTANQFVAFLGLAPGEHSSSTKNNHLSITKAGNTHLRRLLVESANTYSRASPNKSAALKKRQEGNPADIIAYADKANDRLRRKYHKISYRSKANIAKVAVARELACFVWGMMTGRIA